MPVREITAAERLSIEHECARLIARFAERNDARDYETLAAMFVEGGVLRRPTKPDEPIVGPEAILTGFRARPATLLTRHVVTNTVVTVESADRATAVSYILLYTADQPEGTKLPVATHGRQMLGTFHDVIVHGADGAWRFKERNGSLEMTVE